MFKIRMFAIVLIYILRILFYMGLTFGRFSY